jgi:hypothetical protein
LEWPRVDADFAVGCGRDGFARLEALAWRLARALAPFELLFSWDPRGSERR